MIFLFKDREDWSSLILSIYVHLNDLNDLNDHNDSSDLNDHNAYKFNWFKKF